MVHGLQDPSAAIGNKAYKLPVIAAFSGVIACDIVITMSMCYYLHKSRTGLKSTNAMINLLITYTIRTCLLTTLITFLVYPETMISASFYVVGCRLYANSLLSGLNARECIKERGRLKESDTTSTPRCNDTIVIGSPEWWLCIEALNQSHGSSEVNGSTATPV